MVAVSFGYSSGGSGTGFYRNQQFATYVVNDTGVDVYVSSIEMRNVSVARTGTCQIALYNDPLENGVAPGAISGLTATKASLTVGTNTFTISGDPICVAAGAGVWVAWRGPQLDLSPYTISGITVQNNADNASSGDAFPTRWTMGTAYNRMLPVRLIGDTVGPGDPTNLRANYAMAEIATEGNSKSRVDYAFAQPLAEGYSKIRADYVLGQPLCEGYSHIRVCCSFAQALFPVGPEAYMSTTPFPGFGNSTTNPAIPAGKDPFNSALPGLTFDISKRPAFKTRISESPSGMEVRNSLTEYPRWDFELNYEFLEDRTGANSSLKTIMGFFLQMRGSYDSWLFKDPDDYQATDVLIGTGDAATLEFPFVRNMGGFYERIGQVDTVNTVNIYANGVLVNPADYTITMPNRLIFDVAPAAGVIITGSYQYYFVCRFIEDQMDFEKFADKLWSLQQVEFRSIIA